MFRFEEIVFGGLIYGVGIVVMGIVYAPYYLVLCPLKGMAWAAGYASKELGHAYAKGRVAKCKEISREFKETEFKEQRRQKEITLKDVQDYYGR